MLRTSDRSSTSTRRSGDDPSRSSIDEVDTTHSNGHLVEDDDDYDDYNDEEFEKLRFLQNGNASKRAAAQAYSVPTTGGIVKLKPLRNCLRRIIPSRLTRLFHARLILFLLFLLSLFLILGGGGLWAYKKGTQDGGSPPWYPSPRGGTVGSWSTSYERAAQLVRQMTLVAKVNVTTGTGWQNGPCVGNTGTAMRVGLPSMCLQDGPLGIRFADGITASPAGITVGATFNKELMYKRGRMLGLEARKKGVHVLLGPSVGPLGRMPAGGRNWEGFGADPVLQGIAAAETIKGIQEEGVLATVKHFVGNEQEHFRQAFEWGLPYAISSNIDDRTLHELYAWPFADSIRAGVASVMCSYNQVNNSYACQNSKLLNGVLKDELGFQGFIVSDWLAQRSGVASALAGLDMSMPGDGHTWANGRSFWGSELTTAVLNGSVPIIRLNDMVTRIVAAWYKYGNKDAKEWPGGPNFSSWTNETYGKLYPGSPDSPTGLVNHNIDAAESGIFSHQSLSRQIAAEGTVLLKNEGRILPLSRKGWPQRDDHDRIIDSNNRYRIGVYGEDAGPAPDGPNSCPDRACNKGTLGMGWGSGTVEYPFLQTPIQSLRNRFYVESVSLTSILNNSLPSKNAATKVKKQDMCIVFVNANSGEGYASTEGIKGDRNNLNLQKNGDKLINDVANNCGVEHDRFGQGDKTGPKTHRSPTIVIIHSVGPVILERFIENPNIHAVLLANLPGEVSGFALADVLFGDVNPSGRLPYTIGKRAADYGPGSKILFYPTQRIPQQDFTESLLIDYRHFDENRITPRYEFGYGLSYTTFELENLQIKSNLGENKTRPDPFPAPRPQDDRGPVQFETVVPLSPSDAIFPKKLRPLRKFIYPYLSSTQSKSLRNAKPVASLGAEHPKSAAGGGEGGNPSLYEKLVRVEATVVNRGPRDGQAVAFLFVRFPKAVMELENGTIQADSPHAKRQLLGSSAEEIKFPYRVLRGFEKVHTYVGEGAKNAGTDRAKVVFELTRRDLSYWSARHQNWIIPDGTFSVEISFSSRGRDREDQLTGNVF